MVYNPEIHHRKSIRLKEYDYSKEGLYFITICTHNRQHLFGEIDNNQMILNHAGKMINKWVLKLPEKFENDNIELHNYVVMPNHFHCIIEIKFNEEYVDSVGAIPCNRPIHLVTNPMYLTKNVVSQEHDQGENMVSPLRGIGRFVSWFKRMTTNEYINMVKQNILAPFYKKIWQRNYYEHIIKNEKSYKKIAEYIVNNPILWNDDIYNK
ncbi:MAG: hypothetical protein JW870_18625 [Candidatus Delongbacteria bacterium]|nr:hypothetical protein [Candidatus Delongbacteria bacterium]MBN2795854.1 hypothetical protein [Clostridia bacterium]